MIIFDMPYWLSVFILFAWGALLLSVSFVAFVHGLNKLDRYRANKA